jgi:hypothetical protein
MTLPIDGFREDFNTKSMGRPNSSDNSFSNEIRSSRSSLEGLERSIRISRSLFSF